LGVSVKETNLNSFIMKKILGILATSLSVLAISCQKDLDLVPQMDELNEKSAQIVAGEITVDNAIADINFESDFFIGAEGMMMGMPGEMNGGMHNMMQGGMNGGTMQNGNQGEQFHYQMGQNPQFSMHGNQGQSPDSMVINYGMGTHFSNGRVLSGEMIIHNTEEANGNSFMREITYHNFSVDSMMLSGTTTMEITNGFNGGKMHNVSEDIWITLSDGSVVHRQSEISREWIEGESTPLVQTDDKMQITGYVSNTIIENGVETVYKKEIVEPLVKTTSCRYFVSGIIELTSGGNVVATLNYGDGECDDVATLSKTGEEPVDILLSENDHSYGMMGNNSNNYTHRGDGMGMGMGTSTNGDEHNGNGMGMGTSTNDDQHSGDGMGMGMGTSNNGDEHTGNGMGMGMGTSTNGDEHTGDGMGMGMGTSTNGDEHNGDGMGMGMGTSTNGDEHNGNGMGMGMGTSTNGDQHSGDGMGMGTSTSGNQNNGSTTGMGTGTPNNGTGTDMGTGSPTNNPQNGTNEGSNSNQGGSENGDEHSAHHG
jgi:hypothetical protein